MQIASTDEDGQVTIHYDSRWANPEAFGYKPTDLQYILLRRMWEELHKEEEDEATQTEG